MKIHPLLLAALSLTAAVAPLAASPDKALIERGRHLVDLMACAQCHGRRDAKSGHAVPGDLSGSTIGRMEKDVGVFWPPNLTPDKETGLGTWSDADIIAALRKGVRPDGRELATVMPSQRYAKSLSEAEVKAIVAYLRSLKPVKHKVPDPVGIGQESPLPYFAIVPPGIVK